MKTLLVPFFIMLSAICLFAQTSETPSTSYRHDIGFNTTFILQGVLQSDQTPFSLMYKKYTAENKAWRMGVDAFLNLNNTDSKSSGSSFYENSSAYIAVVIGKEFQRNIEKRWTWYYGGDIVPFYSMSNQDQFQNGELYYEYEDGRYGVSLRPFLGIRFNINPRLYLSAEANVGLMYARTKNYANYVGNQVPYTDTKGSNLTFSINPATGLFLYYRF